MLLLQDGSTHGWLPDTPEQQDLSITLDGATGQISSVFLTDEAGTMSSFAGPRSKEAFIEPLARKASE